MTLRINKHSGVRGNILMIAMIVTLLIGTGIASFLMLVQSQHLSVARSQSWNAALAMAESGVEEALAQVNVNFGTNYFSSALTNWGELTTGVYGPKTVTNGSISYSVIIISDTPGPTIIATGYAKVPISSQIVKRTVKIATTPAFAFGGAIAALQDVTMKGNNIMIDSYDSTDPNYSTNGRYDVSKRKAGGDVSSTSGLLDVGNADIYGHVRTAPFGSASTGPQGQVGDLSWTGPGIKPGWYVNDYNADFPDVTAPFTSGLGVPTGTGTNTYELTGTGTGTTDYYVDGDLTLKNNETLLVKGTGKVRLYVTGNFAMQGQQGSYISIVSGATLQLYVGTKSGSAVSTTFMNVNNAGNAANFQYYGLPSNTTATWSGNAEYMGTVYAPQAKFDLGGGGNNTWDFQGSCVVKSVSMNGHFNFHYDENLKKSGPASGFTLASWREL